VEVSITGNTDELVANRVGKAEMSCSDSGGNEDSETDKLENEWKIFR